MWGNQPTYILNINTIIALAHLAIAYMTYILVKRNSSDVDTKEKSK